LGEGVGVPPLAALADKAVEEGKNVTAIVGAITASELLFVDRLENIGARVLTCTDDGTAGKKGFTTDLLRDLLQKETFDSCYTCGPEIMMVKVLEQTKAKGIPTQVSMERYVKCGIGICGHCIVDGTGQRVCKEGPVFRDIEVEKITEFGKYRRDASGTKVYFRNR
jgi:dihydroorotate dehydrogenase electron transfer subunit